MEIPQSPEERRMERQQFLILWPLLVPGYGPGCASWEATGASGTQSPGQGDLGEVTSCQALLLTMEAGAGRASSDEPVVRERQLKHQTLDPESPQVFKARLDMGV